MAEPTDAPCVPITVHTYGLTDEAWSAAFDRVGNAAHAKDELLFTASAGTCPHCEDKPEPTWRDVIRAARAAGWTSRPDPDQARVRIWGVYHPERFYADMEHGWARVYGHGLVMDLAGPSASFTPETVHLISPTPARVLEAARLVGLGGSDGGAS